MSQQSQIIHEAFQELKSLKEATFPFDKQGAAELQKFLHKDTFEPSDIEIVDPDAYVEKDLKKNYSGDVVLQCCVCRGCISKSPDEVIIDEDSQRANIDEECPYCLNTSGFKVIAQFPGEEEIEETTVEDETIDDGEDIAIDVDNITVEEKEDKEPEEKEKDSLTEGKKEVEDLWDEVYDSLIFVNKQIRLDPNDIRSNRVFPGIFNENRVDFNYKTDDETAIIIKIENDEELEQASEILDSQFGEVGVTYEVVKDKYDKRFPRRLIVHVPEDEIITDIEDKIINEDMDNENADIVLEEGDIKFFDEETGNIVLTQEASNLMNVKVKDTIKATFPNDNGNNLYTFKVTKLDDNGSLHLEYLDSAAIETESLTEAIENISVETDSDVVNVKPSENGKVTVEAQPKEIEAGTLEPVSPDTQVEIEKNNEEATEENSEEVEETEGEDLGLGEEPGVDEEIEEIDETEFDELGESYLKEVYDNIKSFKTTNGYINGNKLKLEGLITFNSGKTAKTSFIFESYNITRKGKYKLIGENLQLSNNKKSFILTGDVKDKKLYLESLTYNYNARDAKNGKLSRVYGTKKLNK